MDLIEQEIFEGPCYSRSDIVDMKLTDSSFIILTKDAIHEWEASSDHPPTRIEPLPIWNFFRDKDKSKIDKISETIMNRLRKELSKWPNIYPLKSSQTHIIAAGYDHKFIYKGT